MDISATIVVIFLTALSLGAIVGLEIYSRRKHAASIESGSRTGTEQTPGSVLEDGVDG